MSPHLETVSVAAVQLQQALSAGSAGRRHGEGLLHVDHPLAQPPLETEHLVELFHLWRSEGTALILHRGRAFHHAFSFLIDFTETIVRRSTMMPQLKKEKLKMSPT